MSGLPSSRRGILFSGWPCAMSDVSNTVIVANSVAPRICFIDSPFRASPSLMDGDRRDGRSSRAAQLQRLENEGKLVDAFRGQLIELQALEHVNAVDRQQNLVH